MALQAIAGVETVEEIEAGRFRLHYLPEQHSPAERVADLAVRSGWGLNELAPERMSLEQEFVDITRSDPTETETQEAAARYSASSWWRCAACTCRRSLGPFWRWNS